MELTVKPQHRLSEARWRRLVAKVSDRSITPAERETLRAHERSYSCVDIHGQIAREVAGRAARRTRIVVDGAAIIQLTPHAELFRRDGERWYRTFSATPNCPPAYERRWAIGTQAGNMDSNLGQRQPRQFTSCTVEPLDFYPDAQPVDVFVR